MILLEAGPQGDRAFDAKAIFAAQLSARGHEVAIDDRVIPEELDRHRKYEVAPFLASIIKSEIDQVLLIGAEQIEDETLLKLRGHGFSPDVPIAAVGRFDNHQAFLGAQSRLAYALGIEPKLVDLSTVHSSALPVTAVSPLTASGQRPLRRIEQAKLELFVFLPPDLADEPSTVQVLAAMDNMAGYRLSIVAPAKGKELIRASRYSQLCVFSYSEVSPVALAQRADVAAFYGDSVPGERMAIFALELMGAGKAVIDATVPAVFERTGAPALRGPEELTALPPYLEHSVLPNLEAIGNHVRDNAWIAARKIERLEIELGLGKPAKDRPEQDNGRHLFFPTNGNGLGHAQRCSLIAAECERPSESIFAAFPSCLPLLQGKGFRCLPLVSRSNVHCEGFAHDLVNYQRLRGSVSSSDHLVFDGGYVFDSVLRTIVETGCKATWIRRGLLQPVQRNAISPEREKAFDQIIVPLEAFDELNNDNRFRMDTARVGPIVQKRAIISRDELRQNLSKRFGLEFDTLVVSALGGGVASDRSAQLQALAMMMEGRKNCLHLVLVWPNARVAPNLYGWDRTRVITTRASAKLLLAADLAVSAAGYNSFHEMLYHRIPTILIPQSAEFMDDQERRAHAATERGLADMVLANELLKLEQTVKSFLDDGRGDDLAKALAKLELPLPGNADAARLLDLGAPK
ncbi:MAG: glycosyltransferase [Boseongicola sp.]